MTHLKKLKENQKVVFSKKCCADHQNGTKLVNQHSLNYFFGLRQNFEETTTKALYEGEEEVP